MVIFPCRLLRVAAVAEGLPIIDVPEQYWIAAVWFDVIDVRRQYDAAFAFALLTQGVQLQEPLPGLLPSVIIPAGGGRKAILFMGSGVC